MKKQIICIDLDNTLADSYTVFIRLSNYYNKFVLQKNSLMFDKYKICYDDFFFSDYFGWNKEETLNFLNYYFPENYKHIKPIKNSSETIKVLKKHFKIFILSSRKNDKRTYEITQNWLTTNKYIFDSLILTDNKIDVLNEYNAFAYIDDNYTSCLNAIQKTNAKVFLIDTFYNHNIKINDQIIRLNKINKILNFLGGNIYVK